MDNPIIATFMIAYSVIFCTTLTMAEKRAAFQQKKLTVDSCAILINAVLPAIFCYLFSGRQSNLILRPSIRHPAFLAATSLLAKVENLPATA